MSILNRLANFQSQRGDVPNQELARELAAAGDTIGIQEIATNLWHQDRAIQSDCIKVLYEIGYIKPELIAPFVTDFLRLLKNKNNRLVWGGMIALATIADLKADEIYRHHEEILTMMTKGSVISVDNGVKILAVLASKNEEYSARLFPELSRHLAICRPKDVAQHAEKSVVAVDHKNKTEFIAVLQKRMIDLSDSQSARVKKVIKVAAPR